MGRPDGTGGDNDEGDNDGDDGQPMNGAANKAPEPAGE
jgi:hypothetical protein